MKSYAIVSGHSSVSAPLGFRMGVLGFMAWILHTHTNFQVFLLHEAGGRLPQTGPTTVPTDRVSLQGFVCRSARHVFETVEEQQKCCRYRVGWCGLAFQPMIRCREAWCIRGKHFHALSSLVKYNFAPSQSSAAYGGVGSGSMILALSLYCPVSMFSLPMARSIRDDPIKCEFRFT